MASHLLASIPHGTFVECFHPDRDPIWWNLIANRPAALGRIAHASDAPGLGWELDEDYIERYRVTTPPDRSVEVPDLLERHRARRSRR